MKHIHLFASLLLAVSVATFSTQALASTSPLQAPARVEATNSNMKILTLAEAQAIKFNWTDAQGVQHTSSIADPATDPRHIVALLREIFINKKVPGIKSANVELPDTGAVCYTITDAALDTKSWPGHSVNDRFQDNNAIRTIYDIPTPLEAKDAAGNVIGHYGDYTPDDEGYTTLLVKTKHDVKIDSVTTQQQLYDEIAANIEEVVLLTQGKYYAKGDGIAKTGALYKTSGTASSFYFISKGRARRRRATDNG
ncbi:MAG: hypothetical protein MRZ38_05305, partial [Muribaculaceae bacterium]|nr:hypothetical protein [Muribaculaceae bacterium]